MARAAPCFPLVGLTIGVAGAGLDFVLGAAAPCGVAAMLTLIFMWGLTGGLHLDGLADTADGFLSSRPRERILEIMKDSSTGPMGVAVMVAVMGLKITSLAAIPDELRWRAILLMPVAGRCAIVVMMGILSYVRPGAGLGAVFVSSRSSFDAFWAVFVLVAAGWLAGGWMGVAIWSASMTLAVGFVSWCHRKIGGYTGDTLGAVCELTETVPFLMAALWGHRGLGI